MAKFSATLTPGDNLVTEEQLPGFCAEVVLARHVVVDDLAVIQDSLDLRGSELRSEKQMGEAAPTHATRNVFASQERSPQSGCRIAGDGLHVNSLKAATGLQRSNQENIQEDAAGNAEIGRTGLETEAPRDLPYGLLGDILGPGAG